MSICLLASCTSGLSVLSAVSPTRSRNIIARFCPWMTRVSGICFCFWKLIWVHLEFRAKFNIIKIHSSTLLQSSPCQSCGLKQQPCICRRVINSSFRFDRDAFTAMYLENEGSSVGANWILSTLDADGDGTITVAEVQTRLSVVLDRYKDNLMKDVSGTVGIL